MTGSAEGDRPRRWLFVKERFAWPRASGHDVHTFHMMKALTELGHAVAVCTLDTPPEPALVGLPLTARYCLAERSPPSGQFPLNLTRSQEKFRGYWGISEVRIQQVAECAAEYNADVVVVSGLNVLPYLGAIAGRTRIWYAADEWVWHHLSQVTAFSPRTWRELKPAIVKGLYERSYRSRLDRVWVVSSADARAFRSFAGVTALDAIPNGVDAEYYCPGDEAQTPNSCAFWGRLDFGPNVQALEWFVRRVWPRVRAAVPDARFRIFGFQPTPEVMALAGGDGIELTPDLPDIRPGVRGCAVTVLPFVSGGGIKNKLLEAAAMGLPVVCTPRVIRGLNGEPPMKVARTPAEWVRALTELWTDEAARRKQGLAARNWVVQHHTWAAAARAAAAGVAEGARA